MNPRLAPLLIVVGSVAASAATTAQAQVELSFPLQGYYRPGKYLPVRVRTHPGGGGAALLLRAQGAVPVSIDSAARGVDVVVPWLAVETMTDVRWSMEGTGGAVEAALTPLEPDQVLVAAVGASPDEAIVMASPLFPGKKAVTVALTADPPMRGYPAAWQSLDALVIRQAPLPPTLDELIRSGVAVVVASEAAPDDKWAWQGGPGGWWVAPAAAGPQGAIHPKAYAPTHGWHPGWPAPQRRRAVLLAVAFCIVAVAATLWRGGWWAATLVAVVAVAAAAAFAAWGSRQPMLRTASGMIAVETAGPAQHDRWDYLRPLRSRELSRPWDQGHTPVFASAAHLLGTDLHLRCGPAGRPLDWTWRASAGTTLAFRSRGFHTAAPTPAPPAHGPPPSPMAELARQAYLSPGDVILQDPGDRGPRDDDWYEVWPTVTIRRASPP